MIVVIDYSMGNLRSIVNRIERLGHKVCISSDAKEIEKADKLILPGVGSFGQGMKNLTDLNLIPTLSNKVLKQSTPILGLCLGMQLFTKSSQEGSMSGLGWIDAETIKFDFKDQRLRIPHVGWNQVAVQQENNLFKGVLEKNRFYFTHSYHVVCKNQGNVLATTHYGNDFVSAVFHKNIYGVQFHPETSHEDGLSLLKNFLELG